MSRIQAIKAVVTGKLPTKEVVRVISIKRQRITQRKQEKSKGRLANAYSRWTDKIPHPAVMSSLDEINSDPDIETAITVLTEMVAASFFTEMGEDVPKTFDKDGKEIPHPNKVKLDAWLEKHRADENIKMAVREAFDKGFFAIDMDPDDDFELKVLPSDSMYMWRRVDEKKPYKFTQEFGGAETDSWSGGDLGRIIWWAHKESPMNPYGKALAFCLQEPIENRKEMTQDGTAVLHRIGYPDRRFECRSEAIRDKVFDEYTKKDPEEAIFLAGIEEGDINEKTSQVQNIRINFEGFQESNDRRITDNLNAPTMSTLRNSTEASATKMIEFFESYAQGIQFSIKRVIENTIFRKVLGEPSPTNPIPNLIWGHKRTGMEKLTGKDIAELKTSGCITLDQAQDLLKKLGLPLKDLPSQPQIPALADPAVPNVGVSDVPKLDPARMKTLQTSLEVIENNFKAKNIGLADAYKEGAKAIRAHVDSAKREVVARLQKDTPGAKLSPEAEAYFKVIAFNIGSQFKQRLMPTGAHSLEGCQSDEKTFKVTVQA